MNDIFISPSAYPTYQIGDQVTIRQWDDMESEFGLNEYGEIKVPKIFTVEMKDLCGKTLTITDVSRHSKPSFDTYFLEGSTYNFSSPMFEQSYPTVVLSSTLTFDDLLQGATP